jgi:glycerol-3-phosphate dehydrogenase (NAD(P)+)
MKQGAVQVAVLGAGNWGTTLAHLIAINGHEVRLLTHTEEASHEINEEHRNHRFAPTLQIHPAVSASHRHEEVIDGAQLVLIAIPSQSFREVCRAAEAFLSPDQFVIHATKGLEGGTHRRMSEVILEETCLRQIGVLSGPNIATEIAAGKLAGTVIASHFPHVVSLGRQVLASRQLMVFSGDDVLGTELSGSFKNIVAIAAGMADEMQVGENAKALLVARGMAEITRLSVAMGASPLTFSGLAGIGDLLVTCASPHSRNHRVGAALARGEPLQRILSQMGMVAEGVYAANAARELAARYELKLPLIERVHRVLYEGLAPAKGLQELMRMPAGRDVGRFDAAQAPHLHASKHSLESRHLD